MNNFNDIKKLKGAFCLINLLEDENEIDSIICDAMSKNLNIEDLSLEDDGCLLESYF